MRAAVSRILRAVAVAVALLAVVGIGACTHTVPARTQTLRETVITQAPAIIGVPERIYVPIPDAMTARCKWIADGALEEMASVARGRKRCLQVYEAQLDEIGKVQGTPVPLDISLRGAP